MRLLFAPERYFFKVESIWTARAGRIAHRPLRAARKMRNPPLAMLEKSREVSPHECLVRRFENARIHRWRVGFSVQHAAILARVFYAHGRAENYLPALTAAALTTRHGVNDSPARSSDFQPFSRIHGYSSDRSLKTGEMALWSMSAMNEPSLPLTLSVHCTFMQ